MSDTTLSLGTPFLSAIGVTESEFLTERRAEALYNVSRRLGAIGFLVISLAWLNRQFWAAWNQTLIEGGHLTLVQWLTMIVFGQFARPCTLLLGAAAERSMEKRTSLLPKDHAHALAIDDKRLIHLPLVGMPLTMPVDEVTEVVEFVRSGEEIHVRAGDTSACLWFVRGDDPSTIATTNISEVVTNVVRRNHCIEVYAGARSTHISDHELSDIVSQLQTGADNVFCTEVESTSISTNAAQTVRFELIV